VVSGRMRCNRGDVARYCERKNGIEGTAIFERTAVLKILTLEDDTPIRSLIEGGRAHYGRPQQSRADAIGGSGDVCESGNSCGFSLHHGLPHGPA
jgi:hypothetical protein